MMETDFSATEYRMTRNIYYADVRMSKAFLSNEWSKYHYVVSIGKAAELYSVEIFAFCVLDDRIQVLAGGKDVKLRTVRRMLTAVMEHYEREAEMDDEKTPVPPDMVIRANIVPIEEAKDAMEVLRYIHLTPFSEGYTILAQEYWWTSYSCYREHHNWNMVNTAPAIRFLSTMYKRPVAALAEYHRRGEAFHNPVPHCIRKGEYGIVPRDDSTTPKGNFNETFMVHA